ncbi:hypothetical protein ACX93W_15850 [Paenibacillus sp. CAU 1782]
MGRTVIYFVSIKPDTAKLEWGTFGEYNNSSSASSGEVAKPELPSGISIQGSFQAATDGKTGAASSAAAATSAESPAALPSAKPQGDSSEKSQPQAAKPDAGSVKASETATGVGGNSESGVSSETAPQAVQGQGRQGEDVADRNGDGDQDAQNALFSEGEGDNKANVNSAHSESEANGSSAQGEEAEEAASFDQTVQSAGDKEEGAGTEAIISTSAVE